MSFSKYSSVTIIAALITTLSTLLLAATISKSNMYLYNTKKDYEYNFAKTNSNTLTSRVINNTISIPAANYDDRTVFIKVKLEGTLSSSILQPAINMSIGDKTITQYFEHGTHGTRYLNISPLLKIAPSENIIITVNAEHLSVKDQGVDIISFIQPIVENKKILVIAPHPDDAEIAAYGLYSSNNAYIITITAGESGAEIYKDIYTNNKAQSYKKGVLRTWDSITIPLLAGVPHDNLVNLGFFDSSLETMFNDKNSTSLSAAIGTGDIKTFRKGNISNLANILSGDSSWNFLVANLAKLLVKINPDIIVMPHPTLDTHPDHKYSTVAVIEAIKSKDIHSGEIFFYSNHFPLSEYFPYGNSNGVVSLYPKFSDGIPFRSFYSQDLSAEKQKDKFFALEAMHDLRINTSGDSFLDIIELTKTKIDNAISGGKYNYFRRSIRPNELFITIHTSDLYE